MFSVMAGLLFITLRFFPGVVQGVVDRFVDQKDITSGRSDLFVLYLDAWMERVWGFLIGYGIGSYVNVLDIWEVPHNSITDILISWGIVGLFLIFVTLWQMLRRGLIGVSKKEYLPALLPVSILIISSMAGQYLTSGFSHTHICFLLLAAGAFVKQSARRSDCKGEIL